MRMVSEAESCDCQMVVCGFEPVGVDNPPKVKSIKEGLVGRTEAMVHLLGYNSFNGYVWNKLFLMDIIRNNNIRFEDGYWACDDVLFAGNYIYYCHNIKVIEDKLYYYRQNNSGANRVRYSGEVQFDKKWLKSFDVTKHFDKLFNDKAVAEACRLHEVREAGIVLRSMAAGKYRGPEYYELKNLVSKNAGLFNRKAEASYTQKISVILTKISPAMELKVWKLVNKV